MPYKLQLKSGEIDLREFRSGGQSHILVPIDRTAYDWCIKTCVDIDTQSWVEDHKKEAQSLRKLQDYGLSPKLLSSDLDPQTTSKLSEPLLLFSDETPKGRRIPYLRIEFIDQHSLADVLPDLSENQFAVVVLQICSALQVLARHKIIHRDIHPQNILVDTHELTIKLLDYGIQKQIDDPEGQDTKTDKRRDAKAD